jgi:hypothetical protein
MSEVALGAKKTAAERDSNARDMVQLARNLVKTEWVRIQTELQ